MKNINHFIKFTFLIISFFILNQNILAQVQGGVISDRTDTRIMDAMTDLTNRKARKGEPPKDVKGSYYFNKNFQLSRVIYFEEELKGKIYLRYNAANDEIEMGDFPQQEDAEEILLKSEKVHAIINGEKYKLISHKSNNTILPESGYLIVLFESDGLGLFLKRKKIYIAGVAARTSLDRSLPPRFVDEITYYYSIGENIPIPLKLSKSNIIKIFGDKGSKVRGFIKENQIKFKESDGLIKIFDFAESL